jgi:cytochrome b
MAHEAARIRVWDVPVRLVHWTVALLVLAAWMTREATRIDLHAAAGYGVLALCLFRIAWGFAGTRHARFAAFMFTPGAALAYLRDALRGRAPRYLGHNPAGSWSIAVLIACELAVTLAGIVAIAGMYRMGPLAGHVAAPLGEAALAWHRYIAWAMLAVIGVHVAGAIASSLAHRENLVASMLSGMKAAQRGDSAPVRAFRGIAVALATLLAGGAAAYAWHASQARSRPLPAAAALLPAAWRDECSSCHLAYPPCLLPERSWNALLAPGADHFGEDLALAEAARGKLQRIAATPEGAATWACWKISASVPANATPLRITATPGWREVHAALAPQSFTAPDSAGRHDCAACHEDAPSSTFDPRRIHLKSQ